MHYRFCPACGGPVTYTMPSGDQRERAVCAACGKIHYQNPNVVVGAVAFWEQRVLLCRRAIAPRIGYWAIPAGYLELEETTEEGACREAWEEAYAELQIVDLLAVYNLAHLSQVQILYLAELKHPHVSPGEESLDVGLFSWEEIPWQELAFPSVSWALRHARQMRLRSKKTPELRSRDLQLDPDLTR